MRCKMKHIIKIFTILAFGVIVLVTLFIGLLTMTEYRPDDVEVLIVENNVSEGVKLNESIRIMTFNIGYSGLGASEDFVMDGGSKGRPDSKEVVEGFLEGILSIIDTYSVDIYLLQEVDIDSRRSYQLNQVEAIRHHLGNDYSSTFAYNFKALFVPFPVSRDFLGPVESGLQTLSVYEISHAERHQFPGSFSWPLRVANLKRAMMVIRIPIENETKELVVINHHMSAYDDGGMRSQEMAYLREFMQNEVDLGNYVIVGGDFNHSFPGTLETFPLDEVLKTFWNVEAMEENYFGDDFTLVFDPTLPTCRLLHQPFVPSDPLNPYNPLDKETQFYIIDGFIISNNVELVEVFTVNQWFEYSDHNPVVMEIILRDE